MATGAIFKFKDPSLYNRPKGQAALRFHTDPPNVYRYAGDCTMDFEKSATKTEIKSSEAPGSPIAAVDFDDITGNVKITFRQLDALGLALAFSGEAKVFTQAAIASRTQTFAAVHTGNLVQLRASDLANAKHAFNTIVTLVETGGEAMVSGVHYRHDSLSGLIQIVAWPAGAESGDPVEVTFSAPQITAAADRTIVQILTETQFNIELVLRQNNDRGTNKKNWYPRLTFGPESGSINLIQAPGTTEVVAVEVSGVLEFDTTQDPGDERGWITELKAVA